MVRLREILKEFPKIIIPEPVDDYTTTRVLTMDYIQGTNIAKLNPAVMVGFDRRGTEKEWGTSILFQSRSNPQPGLGDCHDQL